jgi:hypothetical protein
LQLLTGEGDWAGGLVGLERNPEVVKDLTALSEYTLEVLKTMPESAYRTEIEKRTNFKLKVLSKEPEIYEYYSLFFFHFFLWSRLTITSLIATPEFLIGLAIWED